MWRGFQVYLATNKPLDSLRRWPTSRWYSYGVVRIIDPRVHLHSFDRSGIASFLGSAHRALSDAKRVSRWFDVGGKVRTPWEFMSRAVYKIEGFYNRNRGRSFLEALDFTSTLPSPAELGWHTISNDPGKAHCLFSTDTLWWLDRDTISSCCQPRRCSIWESFWVTSKGGKLQL